MPVQAQSPDRFRKIEEYIKTFPAKPSAPADILMMAREIRRNFTDEEELARAAFFWIASNIVYDCDGYRNGNGLHQLEDVLRQGKGICAGYASLMQYFCTALGLECMTIEGYALGIGVKRLHVDSMAANHAWNAVKVKGQWKLVDATWGSGAANNECTEVFKRIEEGYFFADPERLITNHFPDSDRWQLTKKTYTAEQFIEAAIKRRSGGLSVMDSVIARKVGDTIRFTFHLPNAVNKICISAFNPDGRKSETYCDTLQTNGHGTYYYDHIVIQSGYYRIDFLLWFDTDAPTAYGVNIADVYYINASRRGSTEYPHRLPRQRTKTTGN